MVVGLGVDLVETARVERLLARYGDRFVRKLMDPDESERLPKAADDRVRALSLAVAGKEAASKALGTGWSRGVRWRDVVVTREPEPAVELRARALEVAAEKGSDGRCRIHLGVDGPLARGEVWLLQ
jgi:holo-[acyl-carrier protein] synthase